MGYDQTYILLVTDGTEGDHAAVANAAKLKWKGQMDDSGSVPLGAKSSRMIIGDKEGICDKGPEELQNVKKDDRLFILGHGTFGSSPTLGSKTPDELVSYLHDKGLREAKAVSLVSCNSGWGWGDMLPGSVPKGYTSATQMPFGCLFAEEMGKKGIDTDVRARVGYVTVGKD